MVGGWVVCLIVFYVFVCVSSGKSRLRMVKVEEISTWFCVGENCTWVYLIAKARS